jgi:hypothetical protein
MRERMQETRKPNSNGEILGHSWMIVHDKSTKYLKGKKNYCTTNINSSSLYLVVNLNIAHFI